MALPARRIPARHPRYTFITADLASGRIIDEIPLGGVSFTRGLNEAGTLSGSFAYTARSAALLRPATTPARTALYALRDGRAVWGGIIWTRRIDHGARIVDIGCADWWSYFDHRFIGLTITGGVLDTTSEPDFTETDVNTVARSLLSTAQGYTGGNLGVTASVGDSGVPIDIAYDWFNFTTVGDALRGLAQQENGPDIRFDTLGSIADGFTRQLAIGKPQLGRSAVESGIVLDYGGVGANLEGLVESEDGSTVESVHYALGPGSEEGRLIGVAEAGLVAGGWPRLEGTTTYADDTLDTDDAINARARADLTARAGIRTMPDAATRGLTVGEIDPGDEVRLDIETDWYNDNPAESLTGVWSSSTRVTSFTVTVPDDGANEVVQPVFGDLVVTSRTLTRGRPSTAVEGLSLPTEAPTGGGGTGLYGDGLYGDGIYGE
jgi:hypothetical protein